MKITSTRMSAYLVKAIAPGLFRVLECREHDQVLPDADSAQSSQGLLEKEKRNSGAYEEVRKEYLDARKALFNAISSKTEDIEIFKVFDEKVEMICKKIADEPGNPPKDKIDRPCDEENTFIFEIETYRKAKKSFGNAIVGDLIMHYLINFSRIYDKKLEQHGNSYRKIAITWIRKLKSNGEYAEKMANEVKILAPFCQSDECGDTSDQEIEEKIEMAKHENLIDIIVLVRLKLEISSRCTKFNAEYFRDVSLGVSCLLREILCLYNLYDNITPKKLKSPETFRLLLLNLKEAGISLCLYSCNYFVIKNCTHKVAMNDEEVRKFRSNLLPVKNLFFDLPGGENMVRFLTESGDLNDESILIKPVHYFFEKACFDYLFLVSLKLAKTKENEKFSDLYKELEIFKDHILRLLSYFIKSGFFKLSCEDNMRLLSDDVSFFDFEGEINQLIANLGFSSAEQLKKSLELQLSDFLEASFAELSKEEQESLQDCFPNLSTRLSHEISSELLNSLPEYVLTVEELAEAFLKLKPAKNVLRGLLNISDESKRFKSLKEELSGAYKNLPVFLTGNTFANLKKKATKFIDESRRPSNLSNPHKKENAKRMQNEVCQFLEDRKERQSNFLRSIDRGKSFLADVFEFCPRKDEIIQKQIKDLYDLEIEWCEESIKSLKGIYEKAEKAENKKLKDEARRDARKQAKEETKQNNGIETGSSSGPASSSARSRRKDGCSSNERPKKRHSSRNNRKKYAYRKNQKAKNNFIA